ncbi:L,D-transpeptidase family protein [uncultured Erythrobacter sp.]|uniref:L,D-transpeptidase family protein n=1 Tax=uncultured Erythrobacter sp. TaxID=263913 RepID=UPI00262DE3D2|nr:L,D-transpeptidase family protein [uncultured Erythrobacter sp.]
MAFKSIRLTAFAGLVALAGGASFALAQTSADDAADAAVVVAAEADAAIRAIDPSTGGPSIVVDPSLPQPYGFVTETDVEDLPELPPAPTFDAAPAAPMPEIAAPTVVAPRAPAARMISNPMVQAAPEPAPAQVAQARVTQAASDDPFVVKSILPITGTIRYGEWYWDESRAPSNGPLVITVDLDARVISVFRDGHEIGTAVALLGTTSHPTPLGTFPILTKERDNVSEKYNNAPMPWTLRLTWDGIAIHGSPVMNGYASHGCIGVPDPFAEKLFAITSRGDKVVITRGQYIGVGDRILS